jgi:3-oxoacyl-[acyl-carrier protein] reductase
MKISLSNKNALVGGSTQGLGKAIALQLAQCGANVTIMARNEQKLIETLGELATESGQKHQYLVANFGDFEGFESIITPFLNQNNIDILVNNTNGPEAGGVLDKGVSDYQTAFDLLFKTVCQTTLKVLPNMQKNQFGRIINVSSLTTREPLPHLALSNSIRTALISWSKTLATEVAKDNITVNNILTGYFDTERMQNVMKAQAATKNLEIEVVQQNTLSQIPMKRLGKPEEYGHLATFLASDFASYITGTSIPIDGGLLRAI